ncbi:fungal-specific transcription factor domain-domain-containing protein [Microdochium bolleyi]|uniref:Fungal-specific transcription factor domain-domain-containing protein n=1 Tax=Microdochium bolleyi TaxID=196109 RepID=A0A136IKC5_9PEZI|nr:fungal-specific transcription factor domain-domain-containing protein [Microdochium bolleyi]
MPITALGGFYFDGIHLGGIGSARGVPFFSQQGEQWVLQHTGQCPRTAARHESRCPPQLDSSWKLPPRAVADHYISFFTTSALRHVFPLIDEASFLHVVNTAYCNGSTSPEIICAQACVIAFICVSTHMSGEDGELVRADQCAAHVHRMMPTILANPCSEAIQACTMLCMYNMFTGNNAAAATYLAVAYRFLTMFGAHFDPGDDTFYTTGAQPQPNQHYLRKVFWHCYMYDKDICLRAGYPPIIHDDYCDLSLPLGYKQIGRFDDESEEAEPIPGDMRLAIIKSRMIQTLYSARAVRSSDTELLRHIIKIDDELEGWRMSIPSRYRPSIAPMHRIKLEADWKKAKRVHILIIHFEYCFLLASIHSASGRCRPKTAGAADQASIDSCQELALQASRSILATLADALHVFDHGDFWYFVAYPVSASLTIFCNILTSPGRPAARDDVVLLGTVPNLIQAMGSRLGPQTDGQRTTAVQQFTEELSRLARCAVAATPL